MFSIPSNCISLYKPFRVSISNYISNYSRPRSYHSSIPNAAPATAKNASNTTPDGWSTPAAFLVPGGGVKVELAPADAEGVGDPLLVLVAAAVDLFQLLTIQFVASPVYLAK